MEQFLFYTKKTDTGFIKKLGLFALFLLFGLGAKAQCPTGDVGLYSQADVNNFATNYPNCTEITGNLIISGSAITDLSPLSNLTQIGGFLSIYSNSQLNSLNGLDNLTQIGGVLYISNNSQLTNLDGLSNLTSVGADLVIHYNYSLTDISGLQNIDPTSILSTYYGVGLSIVSNTSLSVCNLPNFCTYLQGSGPRTIADNAGDCVSEAAVNAACNPAPPCDAPTNLSTSNVTSVSATLNWSGTGTYDIEWGTQGFTPGSGTTVTGIASNSYSLTDLDYNTQYQFYVRCQSEPNQWAGPFVFTTLPQCPTGNVILNSQTQVNDFGTNYPNCTEITGYLDISGSDITDLSPLSNIQSIGGYLSIFYNSQLTNLDGLSNLTQIGGYLSISSNSQLTNLDGLSNLTEIGGFLIIYDNSLTNLDGLSALESINGDLGIYNNAVLTDISGLQNIDPATILPTNGLGLYILNNPLLSVCNLDNFCTYLAGSGLRTISGNAGNCYESAVTTACTTSQEPQCPTGNITLNSQAAVDAFGVNYPNCTEITGYLDISGSDITDLSPLSNIQSIGGYLNIFYNSQLTNLDGLSNLTQIGGYLSISSNSQLTNLDGLSNLTQIGGRLSISSNSQLTNLDGLSNLTQIGGYLFIQTNVVLENLDGLIALESINGDLLIYNNAVLTDISGLQNIDPATILPTNGLGLYIQNNPLLSVCNMDNFCTYLAGSGTRTISGNAGDCISEAAVNAACTTSSEPQCPTGDVGLYSQADVNNFATNYPNCTEITGYLYINGSNITDLSPLSNIQSIGGDLFIYNNSQLTNLDGLSNLTEIGGFLIIYDNSLTNLDGLSALESINGDLGIYNNAVLTDISGLQNIDPATILPTNGLGLYILNNPLLSVCNLDNFCTYLAGSGARTISGNAGDCISEAAVNAACSPAPPCDAPTNLSTSNVTSVSATLGWSGTGTYDIEWGTQGFTPGSGTSVTGIASNSYSLTDLDYNTQYQFYVRCQSEPNQWAGPFVFTTLPQCPTGYVSLTSQAEVDAFGVNYPNCTEITGSLHIGGSYNYGSTITDLSPLNNIQSIGDDLYIQINPQLTDIDGLSNLTQIVGFLYISSNSQLTNLDGLSNLTQIGGYFTIQHNAVLENLDGLSALESINGDLFIHNNAVLTDISGLQNIDPDSIFLSHNGVGLYIRNNPLLSVCNLPNFCTYLSNPDNPRNISGNAGDCISEAAVNAACAPACEAPTNLTATATSISATLGWTSTGNNFDIEWGVAGFTQGSGTTVTDITTNSYNLTSLSSNTQYQFYVRQDCTLNQSDWVGPFAFTTLSQCPTGDVILGSQAEVDAFAINYPNCTEITGGVEISGSNITNLDGLSNLTSVGVALRILYNQNLTNLDGLSNLTSVGGQLYFAFNNSLTNLAGLNNLTSIGGNVMFWGTRFTNLDELNNLTSVGGELGFISNNSLTSIEGLSNLTSIGGGIGFAYNNSLTNLTGLQNIDPNSISGQLGLHIIDNPLLSVCNLPNFCTYLHGSGPRTISGNAEDCISEEALLAICPPPTCDVPTQLAATNITINSATLSWTSDGSLFDVEWGVAGFTQGLGTLITDITTNSYNLTSLSSNTQYQFYVRQDCTLNESDWVGPFAFTTLSQCPTGDVILGSQAEVDAFATNYPNCTEVSGNLAIQGANITDLTPLSNLTSVGGYLEVSGTPNLTNIDGLNNLTSIGGDVLFLGTSLTNLDGLNNLTSIGGELGFISNNSLTNLAGLSNVTSIGGGLSFSYNNSLTNLDGLSNLTSIGGDLLITDNSSLTDISGLQNIDPTSILPTNEFGLYIVSNSSLSVCNLDNFCTYLQGSGARTISGNAGDCISEAAVNAACTPACDAPTNLSISNVTSVSATLSWTSAGNNFDIEWGTQGFTQGSGTTVTGITANSYNLTNLDYNTQYQFYIRQDCTVNESDWAGPFSFTTLPQCPTGYLSFYSQADIDAFAINYPNCTQISGSLYISSSDIVNLNGLSNLISVGGDLYIDFNPLTNLDGLSNLTSVGGRLDIYFTPNLTDLDGLSNLTSVGGYLSIAHNSSLTSLNGLSNLTSVGGFLYIEYNQNLTNLDGLSNLTSIGADLVIKNNSSLNSITGLQNIDSATISSTFYGYGLYIVNNPLLSVCNLPNFCTYLQGSGPRTISDNAGDCVSEAAVTAACTPACEAPTNLTATATSISASLGWTSDGDNFDIEWGTQGFTQGSGTTVTDIATNSYNLSGLDYSTQYEFYVRQDCSLNESDWAGPFSFTTLSQCPPNNNWNTLELATQAQVDAFGINYPTCTSLHHLMIGNILNPTDISNLDGLSNLTSLGGFLAIAKNPSLVTLNGLNNLTYVGDRLLISDNHGLLNINGLSNLGYVNDMAIASNSSLVNLDGLINLIAINGQIAIDGNSVLTDISGLENIDPSTISGNLRITNNVSLSVCDLDNFCIYLSNPSNVRDISGNAGECLNAAAVNLACNPVCENPTLLSATNITTDSAELNWSASGTYYDIEWGLQGFTLGEGTIVTNLETTTHTINSLDVYTQYEFYVLSKCSNIELESEWVGPFSFTTLAPPCEAPTDLSTSNMTSDSITLNWTSSVNLFDIQYGSQGFSIGQGMSVTNISDTSYTLNDLTTNAYYDFYVRAKCSLSQSEWVGPYAFMIGLACPNDDVVLTSQTEVNDFVANYPSCTEISGDLIIQGNDISDISVLSNLVGVNGDLKIQNTQLTNLHGLHNLSNLEGDLYVYQNDELISFLGSSNLTSIQGDLYINENLSLENLSGLSNIIQISGGITITNTSLVNLNDLSSLTSMGGNLLISFNTELENLNGLNNLTTIGGYLDINNNSVLGNLNGLSGLTTIEGGEFYIEANAQLSNIVGLHNLNFSNLTAIYIYQNTNLSVCHIDNLCNYLLSSAFRYINDNSGDCQDESALSLACGSPIVIGCPNGDIVFTSQAEVDAFATDYPYCTEITGSLTIGYEMDSTDITDLSALSNITSVGGSLGIFNTQLTSLEGLSSLMSIEEDLQIWDNWELTSLFDHNLASFDGYLDVRNAAMLESLSGFANTTILSGLSLDYTALVNLEGLSNLTSIGSNGLYVAYNILSDFSGLNNLTTIGGSVYIADNYELISFDGLNNLESIVGMLNINWNIALSDISALSNIDYTTIEYLEIYYNSALSECNLPSFCAYFTNSGQGYIEDNAGNCNSEESIIANCGPLCTAPTNLSATNITTDSATLSWTSDGNLFDIEWGAQGFTQGSGTEVNNVGTTTYNLSGLVANTTYDFYVRQNCTINQSTWVGPFTFITLEEEWSPFSSVTLSGFNHDVIADGSQIPSQTTTTAIDGDTSSTNYVLLNGTYNYDGANPTAYLPSDGYFISAQTPDLPYQLAPANQNNSLRLESGQSGALTFATPTAAKSVYVLATSGGGSSQINVTVHFDDNTTQEFTNYTILDWYSGSANYAIQGIGRVQRDGNDLTAVTIRLFEKQFVLSVANQAKNIVSVSFQRTGGGGIANIMGISIENSIIPTCMAPANLTASDITAEGLTISWGAVNNVNNYQWVLVANGADPNTSSPVSSGNTAQNEVTLSGLEQSTLYDFYVKSDCGVANGTSLWAGPFNFKVGYYNEDIPTQYNDYPSITSTDYCTPEPTITIVVPNGMQIAGLQVVYKMTALNGAWMSEQRSFIYSPTLALGESTLAEGSEDSDGTMTYNRSMDFANGATGTVEFTLRAWRTWGGSGCSTYNNKVDSGTWAIIPTFEPFTACAASTTWIGTSWSNGEPTITTKAIIDGALTLTSDLTACELEVTENGSLIIPTNRTFTIKGQVVNNSTSNDFVIESNGILLQIDEVENQGTITVERESTPMYRLDYTIWSSPVSGMLLRDFSDVSIAGGSGTLWNRVYTLGDNAWDQVWASQQQFESDYTSTFAKAKGYMYRAKNAWVTRNSGNPAEADLGVFIGVPNNGTISIDTPFMFNAIGNPYPSPIDGDELLGGGATGLYFWTNANVPDASGNYQLNNWAYYTQAGGTGVQIGDVGVPILIPDGIIQPGQGFVAGTTEDVNQITFNNEMRMSTNGSFFRQMSNERHRFWLNLSDEMAVYNQILVGYMDNATQGVDSGIDAAMFAYEGNSIYSLIDNSEEPFVIQGRELPFTDADVVKLGFRAIESGSFSISLNNFDGIFEQENLIVYLKDNFNQTQHNLKNGAYSFVSEEGFFENRFEVVYQTTMSTDNPNSTDANWIVYRQDKGFQVQTIGFEMKEVEVYDILGRAVYTSKAEGTTHHIPVLGAEGVFIVKVKTTEDKVLNKKVR